MYDQKPRLTISSCPLSPRGEGAAGAIACPNRSLDYASVQAIGPACRAAEQGLLLVGGRTGGNALKGVPQHNPAGTHLFDWEIALEHAALRPEQLNAGLHIRAPVAGQLF